MTFRYNVSHLRRRDRRTDAVEYDDENEEEDDNVESPNKTSKSAESSDENDDAAELSQNASRTNSDNESGDSDNDEDDDAETKQIFDTSVGASSGKKGVKIAENFGIESVEYVRFKIISGEFDIY